ncbi:MAG: hypothetical protein ACXACD_20520 [Candidatus Thorarchaeota archaeon]|jgi:hypothetical protein
MIISVILGIIAGLWHQERRYVMILDVTFALTTSFLSLFYSYPLLYPLFTIGEYFYSWPYTRILLQRTHVYFLLPGFGIGLIEREDLWILYMILAILSPVSVSLGVRFGRLNREAWISADSQPPINSENL